MRSGTSVLVWCMCSNSGTQTMGKVGFVLSTVIFLRAKDVNRRRVSFYFDLMKTFVAAWWKNAV